MTETAACLECEKYRGNDTCWWFGRMTEGQMIDKILHGCEKFRRE